MQCNKRTNFFSLNLFVFPLQTRFLFVSAPNSVNTSTAGRQSLHWCFCLYKRCRWSVCVCVSERERGRLCNVNVCALVCYFDFSALYRFLKSSHTFSSFFFLLAAVSPVYLSILPLYLALFLCLSPPSWMLLWEFYGCIFPVFLSSIQCNFLFYQHLISLEWVVLGTWESSNGDGA